MQNIHHLKDREVGGIKREREKEIDRLREREKERDRQIEREKEREGEIEGERKFPCCTCLFTFNK